MTINDLFIGHFPGCIVYADRSRHEHGDYKTIAHLSYAGNAQIFDQKIPQEVRDRIDADAKKQSAEWDRKIDAEIKARPYYIYDRMLDALKLDEYLDWTKRRKKYETIEAACDVLKHIYKARS